MNIPKRQIYRHRRINNCLDLGEGVDVGEGWGKSRWLIKDIRFLSVVVKIFQN
jgi:hypothetical protein